MMRSRHDCAITGCQTRRTRKSPNQITVARTKRPPRPKKEGCCKDTIPECLVNCCRNNDPEFAIDRQPTLICAAGAVHLSGWDVASRTNGQQQYNDWHVTDKERIRGFLEGSTQEYREILGWITTVVRSRLWEDRVAPDDVIGDTLMKLLLTFREDSFRLESSLKTHVQRITLYTLIDAARRQKRFVADGGACGSSRCRHTTLPYGTR